METIRKWKEQEVKETVNYIEVMAGIIEEIKASDKKYWELERYQAISKNTHEMVKQYKMGKIGGMERFLKEIEKEVDKHFEQLQNKVEKKIGKITGITTIGNNGCDYIFQGEDGKCQIKVVNAGGWNIQRRHTRWTISEVK